MYGEIEGPTDAVARLGGMQDLSQESWRARQDLLDRLMELIGGYGYRRLETPILEPTDLFLRKSGGELASRIYSFSDPGSSLVSLRPEFTSSIMRHYLERAAEIDLPARWHYAGPVFRYDVSHPEASGQFTQIGAELVGSSSIMADVEVLDLAAQVASLLGVADWRLELADLDVLDSILDAVGVSERAKTFIIGSVPLLAQGRQAVDEVLESARRLNLTGHGIEDNYLGKAIEGLDDGRARVVLQGLLQWSAADQLGQRDPNEVVNRLLRKLRGSDTEATLRRGLELTSDLAAVNGEPKAALDSAGAVVRKAGADETAFLRLSQLVDLVLRDPENSGYLALNFGLVRGLAYYNGVVFELKHPECLDSLGGGGRYDGLARALGSSGPVPALGFAFNLEALLSLSDGAKGGELPRERSATLVVATDAGSHGQTLLAIRELRQQGVTAELEVGGLDLEQALTYAGKKGISQVVLVQSDGTRSEHAVE